MSGRLNLPRIADEYWERGWNPFPLPQGAKFPPPVGYTGENQRRITERDLDRWAREWANIGLVMPDGVVGIDADLYKDGNQLPDGLPVTVRSSSRSDGSGIYLYAVPPGTRLPGSIPHVGEAIQWFHRFAVVWPSVHPEGRTYRWLCDNGTEADIPYVDELPPLPEKWLKELTGRPSGRTRKGSSRKHTGSGYKGSAEEWFNGLPSGRMSARVREELRRRIRELRRYQQTGNARHDTMVGAIGKLVALGARRHRGVMQAIDQYADMYLTVMDGEPDRDPEGELARAIIGAVAKFGVAR